MFFAELDGLFLKMLVYMENYGLYFYRKLKQNA